MISCRPRQMNQSECTYKAINGQMNVIQSVEYVSTERAEYRGSCAHIKKNSNNQ